jgi:GNAT superfamily N-acetyltransferase
MTACAIRPAQLSDARRLFEIRQQSILALAVPALSMEQATAWAGSRDLAWMEGVISTNALWVASTDDRLAGWVGLDGQRVIGLYVDPSRTRRGIGSRLLAFVEGHLVSSGARIIELEASWNAEAFYLRRGYQPLSERPHDGPRPMQKVLDSRD